MFSLNSRGKLALFRVLPHTQSYQTCLKLFLPLLLSNKLRLVFPSNFEIVCACSCAVLFNDDYRSLNYVKEQFVVLFQLLKDRTSRDHFLRDIEVPNSNYTRCVRQKR